MPELPEVEIMTRNVRRWVGGRVLAEVQVHDPSVLRGEDAAALLEGIPGEAVRTVERRAKYLVVEIGEAALLWHFRMTGKAVADPGARPSRLSLVCRDGAAVHLVDTRRLGHVEVLPAQAWRRLLDERIGGDEPWPDQREGGWWAARLGSARAVLKVALMDQSRVAGLGNIAASEICWEAGLDPERRPATLKSAEWAALAHCAHAFISRVVAEEAGDEIAFVNEGAHAQGSIFRVYRRAGEPCPRCGAPIERARHAGRSTFRCAGCQG